MRKLASIQRIASLSPIEGADKIVKATVLGWEVVVQKGSFKEGDLVVYCEVDSILPEKPEFEFLRERKFRIKTIKLKGQVSQGICFPMSILKNSGYKEGYDVTDVLGITKHDPQALLEQKEADRIASIQKNRLTKFFMRYPWYRRLVFKPSRLPFPAWIKKTNEDRIQLFPNICTDKADSVFSITEKIDGQSGTFFVIKNDAKWQFWKPYLFGVCSRNFQLLRDDGQSYWDVAKTYDIKRSLIELSKRLEFNSAVIQGEIIGPKIQGNKYKVSHNMLYVFNIIFRSKPMPTFEHGYWAEYLGLTTVPLVDSDVHLKKSIPEMVEYSKGNSILNDSVPREGIVCRDDRGTSFKVINPDFLLKYE